MLFNIVIFLPITREIQQHFTMKDKYQKSRKMTKRALTTFSCSLILGLTWSFGFLMVINEVRLIFEWLFCLSNSLQGNKVRILI